MLRKTKEIKTEDEVDMQTMINSSNLCRNPVGPPLIVTYAFSSAAVILVHVKLPATISDNSSLITRTDSCIHPAPDHPPPVAALLPEPIATLQVVVDTRVARGHAKIELAHFPCNKTTAGNNAIALFSLDTFSILLGLM